MHIVLWAVSVVSLLTPLAPVQGQDPKPAHLDWHGDELPEGAVARLGTPRLRHGSAVECLAFDPDGVLLASGSDDRTVRLWEVKTGKEVQTFRGHSQTITTI